MGSYPEGHDMRKRLQALDVDLALEGVNEDIRRLTDALLYPPRYLRAPLRYRRDPVARTEPLVAVLVA